MVFFGGLRPVRGCTVIFYGCKPEKMGDNRKPRFLLATLKKTMDGFFNGLLAPCPGRKRLIEQRRNEHIAAQRQVIVVSIERRAVNNDLAAIITAKYR